MRLLKAIGKTLILFLAIAIVSESILLPVILTGNGLITTGITFLIFFVLVAYIFY